MRIAKPKEGFNIIVNESVDLLIKSYKDKHPRIEEHWANILDRLKQVAHRVGEDVNWGASGHKIYIAEDIPEMNVPRLKIIYMVLGDTVTIKVVG